MAAVRVTKEAKQAVSVVMRRQLRTEQVGVFRNLFRRLLAPELRQIRRAVEESRESNSMDVLQRWIDDFYPGNEVRIAENVRDPVRVYGSRVASAAFDEVNADVDEEAVVEFSDQYTEGLAARWTRDSVAPVRQVVRDLEGEEMTEALDATLEEWEESRPQTIAEREATQAGSAFAQVAYIAAGVSVMLWRANPGACDLCQEMDGRTAEVRGTFLDPGDEVRPRSDESGTLPVDRIIRHPPLHGLRGKGGVCQCTIVAA